MLIDVVCVLKCLDTPGCSATRAPYMHFMIAICYLTRVFKLAVMAHILHININMHMPTLHMHSIKAKLRREEVIAVRLYTGPAYMQLNGCAPAFLFHS